MNKDIGRYSYDIAFETQVFDGVFWVPVNSLGKTRYTSEEMLEISKLSLKDKKSKISNLYEAIQLFQISEFKGVFDNKDLWINGIHWQTHKTPEEAVLSNEGCCATDTNWLAYFLEDKYEKIGSFCYGNASGDGHITTYIKQGEYYYFIDMMMCRKDSQDYLCEESGSLDHLMNSEWAGFLYKSKNPYDFCGFYRERFKAVNREIPFCFYLRDKSFVSATAVCQNDSEVTFYVPVCDKPCLIYKDTIENHGFLEVEFPQESERIQ